MTQNGEIFLVDLRQLEKNSTPPEWLSWNYLQNNYFSALQKFLYQMSSWSQRGDIVRQSLSKPGCVTETAVFERLGHYWGFLNERPPPAVMAGLKAAADNAK